MSLAEIQVEPERSLIQTEREKKTTPRSSGMRSKLRPNRAADDDKTRHVLFRRAAPTSEEIAAEKAMGHLKIQRHRIDS